MSIQIEDISYSLPKSVLQNECLGKEFPDWDIERLEKRTGVACRHIASENETALDLALEACKKLEKVGYSLTDTVDAIIFCTETPDHPIPPNSNILHGLLNLPNHVIAFDITAGCSGFMYGLELAKALIVSRSAKKVLLVTGDTYSKLIHPKDRAARCLFGDGVAASLIIPAIKDTGVIDLSLGSSGKEYQRFIIPAGGCRLPSDPATSVEFTDESGNIRTQEHIEMDGFGVLSFFNSLVPREVRSILKRNNITADDIDHFIFHQASGIALDTLQRALKIPSKKMVWTLEKTGNLVSASVPVALKMTQEKGRIKPGDTILLCGFGLGMSWGTAILKQPE